MNDNNNANVCHLTSTHKSHDQRILLKECVSLSQHGYDVSLVAQGSSERFEKVNIIGTGEEKGSAFYRLIVRPSKVYKIAKSLDADIYQIHDMELLPYAKKLKRRGKTVVFDCHEDYASRFADSDLLPLPRWMMKLLAKGYVAYEKSALKSLDALISVTPYVCDRLETINPRTEMVTNYPFLNDGAWGAPIEYNPQSGYVFFAGQVSSTLYRLDTAVKAVQEFDGLRLKMCGPARREGDIEALQYLDIGKRVDYLGVLPFNKLPAFYSGARAALVTCAYTKNTNGKHGTLGVNKLFEAMLRGVPVICTDFDLWEEIIDTYHCGICVEPGDYNALVDAIRYILDHPDEAVQMGENGRRAVEERFNWTTEEKKLLALYSDLLNR